MNTHQRFGATVRRLRGAGGYSQEGFAARAHIDRAYFSRIERGRANVSLEMLVRIAKALGCTACDLLEEAGL
jgi:transcriptional regulator with XRE-family HTH domain